MAPDSAIELRETFFVSAVAHQRAAADRLRNADPGREALVVGRFRDDGPRRASSNAPKVARRQSSNKLILAMHDIDKINIISP